jgi:polyisoprenoid-binding protein YceI
MYKSAVVFAVLCALAGALAARPAFAAAQPWVIDPVHSSIVFSITHNNGAGLVYGRFDKLSGAITADPEHPEDSSVEVQVDASSVDTAVEARDNDLRSEKYFNAAQYAALSFKSTGVKAVDGQPGQYEVTGDMTMLGVTRPVTFTIKQHATTTNKKGQQITGFDTAFTVKRSDFGMTTGIPMLGDDVDVIVSFECDQPQPESAAMPAKAS